MTQPTKLQPIVTGMGCFPKLREKGCVYVDKTAYFHRLITAPDDNCFFLARPRRFGKSLMISTLQAIFEGRRELFEGLDISRTDWAWEKYPVLYFNFGFASAISAEDFAKTFPGEVKRAIVSAEMTYDIHEDASTNFGNAIDVLNERNNGHGVVILIDEYDDPVAQLLHKPDEAEAVRARLAAFYHQMKDRVGKIRFLMITGVSKFTKMSVFSALSNLVDLSFDEVSAAMLGYTEEELDRYFADRMSLHAQRLGFSYGAYRAELKRWFNGYRFGKFSTAKVYNPVSIGVNLKKMEPVMIPSWAETGKSSMLMNYLNRQEYLSVNTEEITGVEEREFDVTDIRRLKTIPMLYQTGYLTIREYNPMTRTYDLGIPNEEVRQDLATLTMEAMTDGNADWAPSLGAKMLRNRWPEFFQGLQSLFASLPYGSREQNIQEFSYERVLLTMLRCQGIQCRAEEVQADGRADIIAEHAVGVYIFELKVNESAEEALAQVKRKRYEAPYLAGTRPIWLVGLNFDRATHHLAAWKLEQVSPERA